MNTIITRENGASPTLAVVARLDSVSMVSWVLTGKMSRPYRAIVLRTMRSSERLSGYFLRLIETWSRAAGSITACSSNHLCWPQERQAWRVAQAAFVYYDSVMPILNAPAEQMLVCGMSLGYADPDALVNTYRTERLDAREFMTVLN